MSWKKGRMDLGLTFITTHSLDKRWFLHKVMRPRKSAPIRLGLPSSTRYYDYDRRVSKCWLRLRQRRAARPRLNRYLRIDSMKLPRWSE